MYSIWPLRAKPPPLKLLGKPHSTRRANFASTRLVMPGIWFCSCTYSGTRSSVAAMPPGPAAKPPKLIAARGRMRRKICSACKTARASIHGATIFFIKPLPRSPATFTPLKESFFVGISLLSKLFEEPNQLTSTSRFAKSAATARPGKTWPPVPPAMIMTLPVLMTYSPQRPSLAPG